MKITMLGGGREVGRSAILIEDEKSIVLDYGTKIEPEPPTYPLECKPDFAVLSHAHLDHCGGLPILYKHSKSKMFMTDVTMELAALLIKDSIKVAKKEGFNIPFSQTDATKAIHHTKIVKYQEHFRMGKFTGQLYDAGHIPGSAGVLLSGKKDVFYTGDIQTTESSLLHGCRLPSSADVLVTESTYSQRNHPDRRAEASRLKQLVDEALANDGSILLPVFAVGRSQEVLLMLKDYADMIAIDGMCKAASEIVADYGSYVKDAKVLRELLSRIKFIHTNEEREIATKKHQIIISSAGMLGGGPAVRYLRELKDDENSKVVFTGFLVEGTPGNRLLKTGVFENEEERFEVKCSLDKLDLSAHTDKSGLYMIIEKLKPSLVLTVHGDDCQGFSKEIESTLGIESHALSNGESIAV